MSQEIDAYIVGFSEPQLSMLRQIRDMGRKLVPSSVEVISYQIPAFRLNDRMLFFYAGWSDYVSLYPIPAMTDEQMRALEPYIKGKGTLHFSLKQPLPVEIIEAVILAHVEANNNRRK
ncbi:MAG: DUF1801 domain-containing protein [Candidatus Saccharimonadales bacterium]